MDGKSARLRVYIGRSQPKFFMPAALAKSMSSARRKMPQINGAKSNGAKTACTWASTATARAYLFHRKILNRSSNESASGIYAGLRATRSHAHRTLPMLR